MNRKARISPRCPPALQGYLGKTDAEESAALLKALADPARLVGLRKAQTLSSSRRITTEQKSSRRQKKASK